MFFGCSDGMEREACVCDHGYERSDLCAEIIIIIIIIIMMRDWILRPNASQPLRRPGWALWLFPLQTRALSSILVY